jgi:hypothetical protein
VDTGAERTVIGKVQALAYGKQRGIKYKPKPSENVFMFGVDRKRSLGTISLRIPTSDGSFIEVEADVVPTNIPFLLELDSLDAFGVDVSTTLNKVICSQQNWTLNLVRRRGHLYV